MAASTASKARTKRLRRRARYHFDNALLRGSAPVLVWLAIGTAAVIAVAGLFVWATGWGPADQETDLPESLWLAITRSLDPGTFGGDSGARFRAVALVVTVIGVFILAMIIALVNTGLERRLDELRKGRSFVPEKQHQLILGWSSKVPGIVEELVEANRAGTLRHPAIVVMTDRPAAEVEHDIRTHVKKFANSRLVVRSGDPANVTDLQRVQPLAARSVIVVSPSGEDPDAHVVRQAMALLHLFQDPGAGGGQAGEGLSEVELPGVVLEMKDRELADSLIRGLEAGGAGTMSVILPEEVIGKVCGQVLRSPGLSAVFEDLLDFANQEFYEVKVPDGLKQATFGDVGLAWERACPVGIVDQHRVVLVPDPSTPLSSVHSLILLAEDDDDEALKLASSSSKPGSPESSAGHVRTATTLPSARSASHMEPVRSEGLDSEAVLVVGWSAIGRSVVSQIKHDLGSHAKVTVALDPGHVPQDEIDHLRRTLRVEDLQLDDTASPGFVRSLLVGNGYGHILVLCYRDTLSPADAEAHALLTLLHVHHALQDQAGRSPNVVTELLDRADEDLARTLAAPDDFIISDRIVSLLLAQVSETPRLRHVFDDLFDADGTDVVIRRMPESGGGTRTFADAVLWAAERGEIAIGLKVDPAPPKGSSVRLNPDRKKPISPRDSVVVLRAASPRARGVAPAAAASYEVPV